MITNIIPRFTEKRIFVVKCNDLKNALIYTINQLITVSDYRVELTDILSEDYFLSLKKMIGSNTVQLIIALYNKDFDIEVKEITSELKKSGILDRHGNQMTNISVEFKKIQSLDSCEELSHTIFSSFKDEIKLYFYNLYDDFKEFSKYSNAQENSIRILEKVIGENEYLKILYDYTFYTNNRVVIESLNNELKEVFSDKVC